MPQRIVIVGAGFAGLWAALGAARKADELGLGAEKLELVVVEPNSYHNIRVRNYEADLSQVAIPLSRLLPPAGIRQVKGKTTAVFAEAREVEVFTENGTERLPYDRLVLAAGSHLYHPPVPGLAQFSFDVDTYRGAMRLSEHLSSLPKKHASDGRFTVAVVGAGLTGLETACEMVDRLKVLSDGKDYRVLLIDHKPYVGSDMGEYARPFIEEAIAHLGIETRLQASVKEICEHALVLGSGETIPCLTTVWTAGMRANDLAKSVAAPCDPIGRIAVDKFLRLESVSGVFAAGDVAHLSTCDGHSSVMSCQHGRPMGRYAGHNVVADLMGLPLLELSLADYVTILDLGSWGAIYTLGWERKVVAWGESAKHTKMQINRERIYPPLSGNRGDLLDAAAPNLQPRPQIYR